MFCPIRASKSRKLSSQQPTKIKSSEVGQNNHNNSKDSHHNTHSSSTSLRQVTVEFHATESDELTVFPGDVVVYESSDSISSGNWSHVFCLKTGKWGFVPSGILSADVRRDPRCTKKKLPRTNFIDEPISIPPSPNSHHHYNNSLRSHHNSHHNLHHKSPSHHQLVAGQIEPLATNRILDPSPVHLHHHQQHINEHRAPSFGACVPHSLHGSSAGKQSFRLYPDLTNLNPPSYYNVRNSDPRYDRYEIESFPRDNFGLSIVTHNFVAREEGDLNVGPGDFVMILNKDDGDWVWVRRGCDNAEGFVPSKYVCDFEHVKAILNKGNSTVTMRSSNQNDFHTYINHTGKFDRESLLTDQQSSVANP